MTNEETTEEVFKRRAKEHACYACGTNERIQKLQKYLVRDNISGFVCKNCAGNDWETSHNDNY